MATLHGWIHGVNIDEETRNRIEQLNAERVILANIVGMNGEIGCHFFLARNHYSNSSFKIIFDLIEELLKEEFNEKMHGLLYLMDDESIHGENWQVFVIRKGKIHQEKDVYLSPSREKIGEYY